MTITDAKIILQEFDRLNLEIIDGLNLLTEAGVVSDLVVLFGDIAHEDGPACVEFLRGFNLTESNQKV